MEEAVKPEGDGDDEQDGSEPGGDWPGSESSRPGPIFDATLRGVFEGDLAGACRALGVPVHGEPQPLSAEFPLTKLAVDLLARVGPGRLLHVEYARRVTRDLVARMLVYRGLIMQHHPKHHVSQHIVVLGEGTVRGHDDLAKHDFAVNLGLHYLRDADPDRFLDGARLAPLAMLHRGDRSELEAIAGRVVRAIRADGGDRVEQLLEFATVLAVIASDPAVVARIIKETEMTAETVAAFYRDTDFGQALRAEGREEGREELLTAMLVERFGPQAEVKAVAHRLAEWQDGAAAVHAISTAADIDDLQQSEPADGRPVT